MRAGSGRLGSRGRWAVAVALVTLIVCAVAAGAAWASGSQASPGALGRPGGRGGLTVREPRRRPGAHHHLVARAPARRLRRHGHRAGHGPRRPRPCRRVTVAVDGVPSPASPPHRRKRRLHADLRAHGRRQRHGDPGRRHDGHADQARRRAAGLPGGRRDHAVGPHQARLHGHAGRYAGLVTVTVYHHGSRSRRASGHAAAGKLMLAAPTNGIGAFPLHVAGRRPAAWPRRSRRPHPARRLQAHRRRLQGPLRAHPARAPRGAALSHARHLVDPLGRGRRLDRRLPEGLPPAAHLRVRRRRLAQARHAQS